ncbi:GNAT family N-acetyltransferase [Macrococcus equipercicus]|uniref:GNAT family N-acetyltransferase n=1 Tax=Macrococcus equipercicus TaxID=69967 RepID=A0ABQ6R8C5_9STAP|nr:peptidogalycan biosysnthesis protein [Macrococcus equipercicus]KAA1039353.1 GNAT family N-acetyltransferase [Macrococcus equipercicus]
MIYHTLNALPIAQLTDMPVDIDYLAYMMAGIDRGIRNVHADVQVMAVSGQLVPVSIKDGRHHDSWIHSFTAQYIDEMIAEVDRMTLKPVMKRSASLLLGAGRLLLRLTKEQTVTVFPSFMSTTLYTDSQFEHVGRITEELTRCFPHHAIVFRTLNTVHDDRAILCLQSAGYKPLISRAVYLFNPNEAHSKNERKDLKKDIKRFNKSGYTVTDQLTEDEFSQLLPLYEQVYLEKYSVHNPHYTEAFFKFLYDELKLQWFIVKDQSRIISFMAVQQVGDTLFPAYFGMDQSVKGLYFMTSGLLYQYAIDNGLKVNNSAGAKDYKLARGSRPALEYHLVYSGHLTGTQKLAYQLFTAVATPLGALLLKRLQFN